MMPKPSREEASVDAISFTDPSVQLCPFSAYRQVQDDRRIHRDPVTGWWEVMRYDDQMAVVRDPALYSSEHMLYGEKTHSPAYAETKKMLEEEGYPSVPSLINADEPIHRRNRDMVEPAFRAGRVKRLEPYIRELVVKLIDDWGDSGEVEFMAQFAVLLPLYVIADSLGVSRDRAIDFKRWSDAMMDVNDPRITAERQIALTREIIELQQFFAAEYEKAKANPGENILGDIARATIDGGPVPTQLAVHILSGLLVAGNETTTSMLGSTMKRLIAQPGMEERLRAEPGRIPDFIEEVLRLESPLSCQFRTNREAVEYGDHILPKDALVVLRFAAGNRDPRRFPDPEKIDIDRTGLKQHLAFGGGIHMCIGHLLARAELKIAYEELLQRFRNFRLTAEPTALPSFIAYGPRTVPIAFDRI
ncbi:Cytochrome P450 [Sphingobium faniae]|nr:Cytochrome P450 [Sphingobium faniae]